MNRRELIIGASALLSTIRAQAQQQQRIGILIGNYPEGDREGQARVAAFLDTFLKLGWADGRNIHIEYRWAGGDLNRIKAGAAEFVTAAPDAIVAVGNPPVTELQKLTTTIPVVFIQIGNPIEAGFVTSVARPGGNLTGFQNFESVVGGKWLGVLKEAAPNLKQVAVLFGGQDPTNVAFLHAIESIAPKLGVNVKPVDVEDEKHFETSIASFADDPDGGLIVVPHSQTIANRASIIILAARYRLPALYPYRYFVTEGGLLSYGPDQIEQWRGAATYVDRILRGEKPGDLPVQAPTRYELTVNMRTARALGLNVPPTLPLRANEVIE
jgi:putative ABC transport system substrate-binding protein